PQASALPFAKLHGDVELFQVLVEKLAAEISLVAREEVTRIAFQLGSCQADYSLAHALQPGGRHSPCQLVPVLLDEAPGDLARVDAMQERTHDVRDILSAEFAIEG